MQKNEEKQEKKAEIKETGSLDLDESRAHHRIKLITIIGEIEGHDAVSGSTKATKYEHLLPMLAEIEDSCEIDGLLILLNTLGGDVEAGLSIAEMIASLTWNHDHPSGKIQWNVHRGRTEFPQYGKNAGSDYGISLKTFPYDAGSD